jgi:lipopolysaccharide transport system ATP-binding protein
VSVIEVRGLSKKYHLGATISHDTLRDTIANGFRYLFRRNSSSITSNNTNKESIWALEDISFDVGQGEILGIIGRNGAGKTTLLKLLSRITEPTGGEIRLHGRVASLLEVGTGFHPELTGRENIYLNGSILGMSRQEIKSRFEEIVDFAETEKFLDTPVKRYSSGMYVRLAFAVAAHLEPEILLVDEVLAVGDIGFQEKCIRKMGNVAREGRTVLVVSHNIRVVETLTERCLYLKDGRLDTQGRTLDVIKQYQGEMLNGKLIDDLPPEFDVEIQEPKVTLRNAGLYAGKTYKKSNLFEPGQPMSLNFEMEALADIPETVVCVRIYRDKIAVSGNNSDHILGKLSLKRGERKKVRVDFEELCLIPGHYTIVIFVLPSYFSRLSDLMGNACNLELIIQGSREYGGGYVYLKQNWSLQ